MTRPGERKRVGGFTLVELLLAMTMMGILAQIAVPNYRTVTMKARAVEVMGAIEVVEQAVRNYQGDLLMWPDEAPAGVVPVGLAEFLPDGYSFIFDEYTLDWDNYPLVDGLPNDPNARRLLGIGVTTSNAMLAQALVKVFGANTWYTVGSKYVLIVERE